MLTHSVKEIRSKEQLCNTLFYIKGTLESIIAKLGKEDLKKEDVVHSYKNFTIIKSAFFNKDLQDVLKQMENMPFYERSKTCLKHLEKSGMDIETFLTLIELDLSRSIKQWDNILTKGIAREYINFVVTNIIELFHFIDCVIQEAIKCSYSELAELYEISSKYGVRWAIASLYLTRAEHLLNKKLKERGIKVIRNKKGEIIPIENVEFKEKLKKLKEVSGLSLEVSFFEAIWKLRNLVIHQHYEPTYDQLEIIRSFVKKLDEI